MAPPVPKFYANENFPLPVVEAMRELGFDVLTSQEVGKAHQRIPDDEVLRFANEQGRVLATINRKDFIRLHREWPQTDEPHSGIVVCTKDNDFSGQAQRIADAVSEISTIRGELIRVYRPS